MRNKVKPASHWPIIKESERTQSVVWSDKIFSDYFPMIVSILLPDHRTKSHSGNRKLPPIVGPKCDMADCCRLPPIIIPPSPPPPRCMFSHCPHFHPIFYPILWSVGQWDAGLKETILMHTHSTKIWQRNASHFMILFAVQEKIRINWFNMFNIL